MKEITRIHIAKTAYDIEVAAKKELEKYIAALERYAEDQEILDDIEIRITELLAERGVEKGGVIVADDVIAVRAQLGEPSDFAPEGVDDMAAGTERFHDEGKRVYRDTDSALAGGVLAGIARYFGIDPLWVRLLFLILLIPSFGTALIVYIILWAIIPPARTAAQKLQARGKPVTLESIKAFSEDEKVSEAAQTTRSILRNLGGVVLIALGLGALVGTVAVVASVLFGVGFDGSHFVSRDMLGSWWFTTAMTLFAFAGGLLAALFLLLANALFRRQWNEKIGRIVVGIIAAGLLVFASGVAAMSYGYQSEMRAVQASMTETKVNLPADFSHIKNLEVTAHALRPLNGPSLELSVQYVVDTHSAPRYELSALPGLEPHIVIDGDTARVAFKSTGLHDRMYGWVQPRLIIRGPALDQLTVHQGNVQYATEYPDVQKSLLVQAGATTRATLTGQYGQLRVLGAGDVDATSSRVNDIVVDTDGGSVQAGVVRTLDVQQPDTCPASSPYDYDVTSVQVQAVSGGKMTYNGRTQDAASVRQGCGAVIIGEERYDEGRYED